MRGEGHYAVRFTRAAGGAPHLPPRKVYGRPQVRRGVGAPSRPTFSTPPPSRRGSSPPSARRSACSRPGLFALDGLKVLRAGLALGFFAAAAGSSPPTPSPSRCRAPAFARAYDCSDEEIARYLRGEELEAEGKGWCAVCCRGYPVGLGKLAGGRLKNHYPKGLRH